jgi:hypothetical protein
MGRPTETLETGVVVVAGIGVLYAAYRLTRGLGSSLGALSDRAEQAYNRAQEAGVEAGIREWQNPECNDPSDPDCFERVEEGRQPILDELGNVIGYRPAGGYNPENP